MYQKELKVPENFKYIAAHLTMRCNLRCGYCHNTFSGDFDRTRFKEVTGQDWIQALNRLQTDLPITLEGGEPTLHQDFFEIIRDLRQDLKLHLITNLQWGKQGLERFLRETSPERFDTGHSYHSIRVSYHPEQVNPEKLAENARKLKQAGFDVGVEAVMFPSPEVLSLIDEMYILCDNAGVDFRPKAFTGIYEGKDDLKRQFSITHGYYSVYPCSAFQDKTRTVRCRIPELFIGPDLRVYRCHRDLLTEQNSLGLLTDTNFQVKYEFKPCNNYGKCHPCDVKSKPDSSRRTRQTSAEIKIIE